jgi:G3E family GTPase
VAPRHTGLADPGPVVQALWPDDALEPGAVLDGVVTVVDASHVKQLLLDPSTGELAQLQVAHADVVLLNKTDLVGDADADATVQAIRGINASAEVLRTHRSVVDLSRILNLGTVAAGGSGRRGAPALTDALRAHQAPPMLEGQAFARGAQGLAAASAKHDGTIGTVYMEVPGVLDEPHFIAWLVRACVCVAISISSAAQKRMLAHYSSSQEGLLWEPECHGARAAEAPPPQVLRAKGMLCCAPGQPHRILQAVRQTYELTDATSREAGAQDESRLVLIGRCLHAARLEATLRDCLQRRA